MKQKFIPGEEWLYVKIYLPLTRADELVAMLHKSMGTLERQGIIDGWFFIRYTDPQFHIRLRMHMPEPDRNIGPALTAVKNIVARSSCANSIDSVVVDTYVRELERYGGRNIVGCEAFFHEDSKSISRLLDGAYSEDTLWQCALSFVVQMLGIGMSTEKERLDFVTRMNRMMMPSTGISHDDTKTLNSKYREMRQEINRWLGREILDKKFAFNHRMTELCREITKSCPECIPSLIHMHCNRLFRLNQRMCEAVAYYFLSKYYSSRIAREREIKVC